MVFTKWHSQTHALTSLMHVTHARQSQTDRPGHSMPPAPFFNGGGGIKKKNYKKEEKKE